MRSLSFSLCCMLFLLCSVTAYTQGRQTVDSLKRILATERTDTIRALLMMELARPYDCEHPDTNIYYAKKAINLSERINYSHGLSLANFLIGKSYAQCKDEYAAAIDWYNKALNYPTHSVIDSYNILFSIALCYGQLAKYNEAIEYYEKALKLNIDNERKIQVLGNAGGLYQRLGSFIKAIDNYQQAYNLLYEGMISTGSTTAEDTLTLMGLKYQIANIYKEFPDYDRALDNYKEVQRLNKDIDFIWFKVLSRLGIGDCYLNSGKYNSAITYYNNVADLLLEENNTTLTTDYYSLTLNRLAETYFIKNMIDSAIYYAHASLQAAEEKQIVTELPKAYLTLGKIYSSKKQYSKAIKYLQKCVSMTRASGASDVLSDGLIILSNAYQKVGNPAKALAAYQEHVTIRDSIFSRKKLQEMTRIDMQGDFDRKLLEDSLHIAKERANAELALQRQRLLTYGGLGGVILLLILSFLIYRNYNQEKRSNKLITEANIAIKEEKEVSESLLLNILPEEVADELKAKGNVDAQQFDNVSVMFTDFVDFTKVGERLSPKELVQELHTCFKAFDEIIDKYNIEKIKTIGDAYLAVAGLPIPNTNHAVDIINAALEINEFVKQRKKALGERGFEVRIGIHSGSVVAGIVGVKKFAYDIWGDTVNIAARMEQTSEPGRINISEHTHALISDDFKFIYRGEIAAKNKGKMKMYFIDA